MTDWALDMISLRTKAVVKDDLEETLKSAVKNSIRQKSEMIELVIPLNLPSCEHGYTVAKKCGFIFSGIIPGGAKADYLIMQMLPGDEPNYDKLIMVGEFEELKNDVLDLVNQT